MNINSFTVFIYGLVLILTCVNLCAAKDYDINYTSCYCAVFKKGDRPKNSSPIIEEDARMQVEISDYGREDCSRLCMVLAEDGEEHAADALCAAYKEDIDNLRVSIYSRLSDEPWVCSSTQTFKPVCCRNHKPVRCGSD